MRFSSMAVSILSQSVPLLAVGHLAGWKKREKRSWLQSRPLRDALLMANQNNKGMLFEKRVGFHGKNDDMLEKKHSGSARLAQDSASSEIPSDDRKALVECDPLSKVTDSGIFDCGMDSHCVENEESEMGGLCVAANVAPSIHRALQTNLTCNEGPDEDGLTCDCSQFNNTSGVGKYTCTLDEYCMERPKLCFTYTSNATGNADGSYNTSECYYFSGVGVESICLSFSNDVTLTECEIKADGVACTSCEPYTCPSNSSANAANYRFDCTNIAPSVEGIACGAYTVFEYFASETASPSASPDEMPTTAPAAGTSSGSSHAAKVTVVASVAAAAWVASYGT